MCVQARKCVCEVEGLDHVNSLCMQLDSVCRCRCVGDSNVLLQPVLVTGPLVQWLAPQ